MKAAAMPRFAFDPDPAPQHGCQSRRNSESQSSAAKLAGGGSVSLAERFENEALLFRRDADPGVGHGEMYSHCIAVGAFTTRLQTDFAVLGEFQGVAEQICDYLAEPIRIGMNHRRHSVAHLASEFDAFIGSSQGKCPNDLL